MFAGKPDEDESDNYSTVNVEDIMIYVPKEYDSKEISIDLKGMGPFRKFTVSLI